MLHTTFSNKFLQGRCVHLKITVKFSIKQHRSGQPHNPDSNHKNAFQTKTEKVQALQRRFEIAVCNFCRNTGQHEHRMHAVVGEHGPRLPGRGLPEARPKSAQVLRPAVREPCPRQLHVVAGIGQADKAPIG